jgi:hypothetical protein
MPAPIPQSPRRCATMWSHNIEERDFTHVVLTVGTNDAKNYVSRAFQKRVWRACLYAAHALARSQIYWSPVIDMNKVPALPPLLASFSGCGSRSSMPWASSLCRERYATALAHFAGGRARGFRGRRISRQQTRLQHWANHISGSCWTKNQRHHHCKDQNKCDFPDITAPSEPGQPNGLIRCSAMATRTRIKVLLSPFQSRLFCKPAIHLS